MPLPTPDDPAQPAPLLRLLRRALARATSPAWWLWRRRPVPRRAVGVLTVAALALASGAGLAAPLALRHLLPAAEDWAAAGALLTRDARPGDAVVISPAWAERLRAVAPQRLPVLAYPRLSGDDLEGVRRVWLVSLPGAPGFGWEAELDLLERAARADAPLALGGLEVARLDVTYPELPLAFLPDRLGGAIVTQGGAACLPDPAGERRCPAGGAGVERVVAEVDGRPLRCLALRGLGTAPLAVAFSTVPVGRLLRGRALVSGAGPVHLTLRVDGEEAGAATLAPGGLRRFRVDTGRWAGQGHALRLEARAPGDATLCVEAVTLP